MTLRPSLHDSLHDCLHDCLHNFPASIETPHLKIPRVIRPADSSLYLSLTGFLWNTPSNSIVPNLHLLFNPHRVDGSFKMNSNIFRTFPPSNIPYHTCNHKWALLKSNTILIFWSCQICSSGPWHYVYQCLLCRHKVCRQCSIKDWSFGLFHPGKHLSWWSPYSVCSWIVVFIWYELSWLYGGEDRHCLTLVWGIFSLTFTSIKWTEIS